MLFCTPLTESSAFFVPTAEKEARAGEGSHQQYEGVHNPKVKGQVTCSAYKAQDPWA